MKLAFILNTPSQVFFYKNIIYELENKGHKVLLIARNYGETYQLLKELKLPFTFYNKYSLNAISKMIFLPIDIYNIVRKLKQFKPDIISGFGIDSALSSFFLKAKSIIFTDSEPTISIFEKIQYLFVIYLSNIIITPKCFKRDLGKNHIKINSFKELAYLHPKYYTPNKKVLNILNLSPNEKYVLIRFNKFDALHDISKRGFSTRDKINLVNKISSISKVFVSFEGECPDELIEYRLSIQNRYIHDLLYYSHLFIADTGTMVTEAAILGTPAIIFHPALRNFGNFEELEEKYEMIWGYEKNPELIVKKAMPLVRSSSLKQKWKIKRDMLINNKIDITKYFVLFFEYIGNSLK
jgi:predicted glycosyltransferase